MPSEETIANIEQLREVAKERDNLVAFVGAGASQPLGIKTWHELMKEMAEKFDTGIDVDKLKDEGKNYPEIASEIYRHIPSHDEYLDFLHQQFRPKKVEWAALHYLLIDRFRAIITTNFDTSFERAFMDRDIAFEIQKLPGFNPLDLLRKRTLVYLHGNNDECKYILRKEEYDVYYPSVSNAQNCSLELESFLREIIKNTTLVFVAFSFEDIYFFEFFKKVVKEELPEEENAHKDTFHKVHPRKAEQQGLLHFAIIPYTEDASEEVKAKQQEEINAIKDLGIKTILFDNSGENYTEITSIIRKLSPAEPVGGKTEG